MARREDNTPKSPSIFLSHCHADKRFARKLARDLTGRGVRVWIDEAEIQLGDSLIEKIQKGIDQMDYLAVVLSPASVSSEWVRREVDIAMHREIRGRRVKVLPLLYKPCNLPPFLEGKLYADCSTAVKYKKSLHLLFNRLELSGSINAGITADLRLKHAKSQASTRSLFGRLRKSRKVEVYRVESFYRWPYESLMSRLIAKPTDKIFLDCSLVSGTQYRCQSSNPHQFITWGLVGHNYLDGENFEDENGNALTSENVEPPDDIWIQIEYVLFHSTRRTDDARLDPFRKHMMAEGLESIRLPVELVPEHLVVGPRNDPWSDWYDMRERTKSARRSLCISTITNIPYINVHTIPEGEDYELVQASICDYQQYYKSPTYSQIFNIFDSYYDWFMSVSSLG
jgi:hypothetical protein